MASLALVLGFVALLLAIIGWIEQRQMQKQISRLQQIVSRLQNQPPAQAPVQPRPMPKVDRQVSAPVETTFIQPEPPAPAAPQKEVSVPATEHKPLVTKPVASPEATIEEPIPEVSEPLVEKLDAAAEATEPEDEATYSLIEPTTAEASKKETLHRLASVAKEVQGGALSGASITGAASKAATPPPRQPKPWYPAKISPRPKQKKVSLEERLGAGVYIWIGGIALMLAGAFLVKYSFDNELLSVQARLSIAGVSGAIMTLASLWLRKRADKVAAAVCAAGVAIMFATVLAATAFFEVLQPWQGFALMAVITAIAVGMSLLHGQFVALLGLVGGFATPTLISGDDKAWGPTFTYLLLLEVGLSVITRKKQWFGLSALTLLASVVTTLAYTLFAWDPNHSQWLVMFALGTAVVFVTNAAKASDQEESRIGWVGRIWLGLGAVGTSALLMAMFVAYSHFSMLELSSLGLLAAGALVLSRFDRRYITLSYLGAGLCGMMLLAWPLAYKAEFAELDPSKYYLLAIGYGSVFFVGGLLCLWRNAQPGMFAWLSAASSLVFVLLAHLGQRHDLPHWLEWWMVYTAASALAIIATAIVWRTRQRHGTLVIDAYALMASASATFAIWFAFDHPWVAPAWCGLAVVIAAVGMRLNLRWLLIPTCWLTAGCISLLIYPGVLHYDLPMRPVFNTMLAHFGLPALGFAAIAWIYHRNPWLWVRSSFQALALVTATITISLQLRLGFDPENLWSAAPTLVEWATYAGFWLAVGSVVIWRFKQVSLDGLRKAAIGIGIFGLITSVLQLLIFSNPLLKQADVGSMLILNWLLYIYGLPCVLAGLFAWLLPSESGPFKKAAGIVSFVLLFALVTLQVRHGFMGQDEMPLRLDNGIGLHEWATYSTAWIAVSLAIFWLSRWVKITALRQAATVIGWAGLAAAVLGPLALDNPMLKSANLGELRVLNWLLYIYGVPALLAFLLARLADKNSPLRQVGYALSFVLLFVLASLQIRHGFTGPDTQWSENNDISLHEWATYSVIWLTLAIVLSWIGSRLKMKPFEWAGVAIGVAGFVASIVGPLGVDNPLFHQTDVGSLRVLNWLLYLYGLPCVLAAVLGYTSRIKEVPMKPIATVVSLLLLFVFVSLEVRQGFVGSDLLLKTHPITQAESYGYSMAWVSLALILLAGGLVTGSTALRYGSLAVMLVAVGKVAIDSFKLQDLWRVLSLLGLGLSLIVLGYVYQRYVFRRPKQSEIEAKKPTSMMESETD